MQLDRAVPQTCRSEFLFNKIISHLRLKMSHQASESRLSSRRSRELNLESDEVPDEEVFGFDTDAHEEDDDSVDVQELRYPFSEEEPVLPAENLEELDHKARQHEIQRLCGMGVLIGDEGIDEGSLDKPLSAKFVIARRAKRDADGAYWLRRARLCAREFAVEDQDDCFSPSSSTLIPALMMTGAIPSTHVLCSLDIGDAFLQVDQVRLRRVAVKEMQLNFVIAKCLPGQRTAAKQWYKQIVSDLVDSLGMQMCVENPSIFKGEHGCGIIHVDDILVCMASAWLKEKFLPRLQEVQDFICSCRRAWMKRKYRLTEQGLDVVPSAKHIAGLVEQYTMYTGKAPRIYRTPVMGDLFRHDDTEPLPAKQHQWYRSLVGLALYIGHERSDVQFAVKSLSAYLCRPTWHAWRALSRLVGYLAGTTTYCVSYKRGVCGQTFLQRLGDAEVPPRPEICIEVFTDSDWEGSWMKSTSSATFCINGLCIGGISRSQKVVSLSSTEAEWYAACGGVCEAKFLQYCTDFITSKPSRLTLLIDNNGAKQIAVKVGSSRLKHMNGRYLWIQTEIEAARLEIKKVSTDLNPADIGTKPLTAQRLCCLLYMLGCTKDGTEPVGQDQFEAMMVKKNMRVEVKNICRALCEQNHTMHTGNAQTAKQLLRIALISTCAIRTDGAVQTSVVSTEALGRGVLSESDVWCRIFLLILFIALTCAVFLLWRRIVHVEMRFNTAVYNYEAGIEEMRDWAEHQFGMLFGADDEQRGWLAALEQREPKEELNESVADDESLDEVFLMNHPNEDVARDTRRQYDRAMSVAADAARRRNRNAGQGSD